MLTPIRKPALTRGRYAYHKYAQYTNVTANDEFYDTKDRKKVHSDAWEGHPG